MSPPRTPPLQTQPNGMSSDIAPRQPQRRRVQVLAEDHELPALPILPAKKVVLPVTSVVALSGTRRWAQAGPSLPPTQPLSRMGMMLMMAHH